MRGLRLGIVGSEAAKFTPETELKARKVIRALFEEFKPHVVVSGKCPLGGIDIWAIEEAKAHHVLWTLDHKIATVEFPPEVNQWDPPGEIGYKARNLSVAGHSDVLVCITLKVLPETYHGMRFERCYHHPSQQEIPVHVKSGGCWTMAQAERRGKVTRLVVIE